MENTSESFSTLVKIQIQYFPYTINLAVAFLKENVCGIFLKSLRIVPSVLLLGLIPISCCLFVGQASFFLIATHSIA